MNQSFYDNRSFIMDDRQKENRAYEEFSKSCYREYGAEHKTERNYRKSSRMLSAKKRRHRQIPSIFGAVLAVLILIVVLIACFNTHNSDILKGTWDLDGVTVYRFDGKGTGSLDLPGSSYAFVYEIKDDVLSIDFESEAARDKTYTFTVDKNKLMLTDGEGKGTKIFELTKQEN